MRCRFFSDWKYSRDKENPDEGEEGRCQLHSIEGN